MELTIPRKSLIGLLTQVSAVADRKSTMPILSHVLFTADGPLLRLSATDLYLGLSGTVPADITKPGSMAIPAKELLDRVKQMPDGPLTLSQNEKGQTALKATGSARRYLLAGLPGTDFPPLAKAAEGAPTLGIDADVLEGLIAQTSFSVSTDETRAHLNSALFEWEGETVRMVSTDGHRLTKVEAKVAGAASSTMLIPLKAVLELRRLCEAAKANPTVAGEKARVTITQSGSSAFFEAGGLTFSTKLVDAQFPPYAQVIPKSSSKIVKVPRAALAEALRAVSVAANERTGIIAFAFGKGLLGLKGESAESGEGCDEVAVDYFGPPMTIGFNAKYVLDVLGVLGDDEVTFGLTGELDPMVAKSDGASGFVGVIMPARV